MINLHGSIHENICPHCGRTYPLEYIRASKKVPLGEDCSRVIRPQVALFGEMMDSQLMTRATWEIENADTLILLGTTLDSEVFSKYIKYFEGTNLVIIHKEHHHSDSRADLVIWDEPRNVFTNRGYYCEKDVYKRQGQKYGISVSLLNSGRTCGVMKTEGNVAEALQLRQ